MSESQRANRFIQLLRRLRSSGPQTKADDAAISTIAQAPPERTETVIRRDKEPHKLSQFFQETAVFPDSKSALESFGWRELPAGGGPVIEAGATACITLAYKYSEAGVPLERRHLCVAKYQLADDFRSAWRDAEVLSGIVHENVVNFFGMFRIEPEHDARDRHNYPLPSQVWLLLEYANAGDMRKEISRYMQQPVPRGAAGKRMQAAAGPVIRKTGIPEAGCRYYGRQIASGLKYAHSKGVIHNDLHVRNILLKYNHDGSKTCMVCDFGECFFLSEWEMANGHHGRFELDIAYLCLILATMIGLDPPDSMHQICDIGYRAGRPYSGAPSSVDKFLQLDWFDGPSVPPIPKSPTPLLSSEVVDKIGFKPQAHPTGVEDPHGRAREKEPSLWRRAGKSLSSLKNRVTHRFKSKGSVEPEASLEAGPSGLPSRSGREVGQEVTHVSPSAEAEDEGWELPAPADKRSRSVKVPKKLRRMFRRKSPK